MAALTSSDPDILDMSATDVSVDGALIVGQANLAGKGWAGAFIWDAEYGARNLETILVAEGVDLTGWTLSGASAISDDGTTIVGWGKNPDGDQEAWVACLMLCEDDVDVDSSSDEASNDDEIVEDSDPEESDTSEDDTPEDMDETDGSDDAEDSSEESSDDVEDSGSDTNSSDDADPDNEDESDHDYGHHHDADHDSHHDDEDEDHDRDGMPDSFEVEFGLDPFDARDANDDLDHDGIPNVKEYLYGARMDIITAASSTPLEDAGSGGGGSVGPAGILMLLMLYLSLMMWGRKKTSLPEQQ